MKHLLKTVALIVAFFNFMVCYSANSTSQEDDAYINYVRANVASDTWESFCLPFEVNIAELSMYFDHVYIMGKDQGELLYDNPVDEPLSAPRRVTDIALPYGSFGFSAPGSNYYHLFFCDVVDMMASLTRGVPFFCHVREGVEGDINLHGFSYFTDEEADNISFETEFIMYKKKNLTTFWSDDERYIATTGVLSETSTLADDGLTYFEMNSEGKFERIEQSDVEVGHAYLSCLADSRTKIVYYSRTLLKLQQIISIDNGEVIDYLDLDDTAPEILYGDYFPGNITYSREEEAGNFATFCMPFDFNVNDVEGFNEVYFILPIALYGEDTKRLRLFFLSSNDINGFDGYVLAGEPFIALVDGDVEIKNCIPTYYNDEFIFNVWDTEVCAYNWDEGAGLTPRNRDLEVVFTGTLQDVIVDDLDVADDVIKIFDNEGGIVDMASGVIPAYRSALTVESFGSNMVKAVDTSFRDYNDEDVTAIRDYFINRRYSANGAVYSVDGRLVKTGNNITDLQPGIYIVNGKKIVKK